MANLPNNQILSDKIKLLKEQYKKNLTQKRGVLSQIWNEILGNENLSKNLKELYLLLHNLNGTGTTFGYMQITEHARLLEYIIKSFQSEQPVISKEQLDQIDVLIQDLLLDLENPAEMEQFPSNKDNCAAIDEGYLIYLVDDDIYFANELTLQLTSAGYKVKVFSHPDAIMEQGAIDRPALILMDMVFTDVEFVGVDYIKRYKADIDSTVPVIFISVRDDLEFRLRALRSGSDYYFVKPLDIDHFLNVLEHILCRNTKSPFRVLIVDDDEVIMYYYKIVLTDAGMEAEGISNPLQVLSLIKEFMPDIILMDINMPFCNGIELANIIRQYPILFSIPIIFLTTETNFDIRNNAIDLGAEEYILKPIAPKQLVRVITSRAKRSRQIKEISNELIENKNRTNSIMETLHDVIWSTEPTNWSLAFISTSSQSVLGKTAEELKNSRDWRNFIHADDKDFVLSEIDKLKDQNSIEVVYRVLKTDGTIRWVLENIQKIKNENTGLYRFDGIIHDITAREIDKQNIKRRLELESELALFTRSLLQNNDFDLAFESLLKMTNAGVIQIFHAQPQEQESHTYMSLFKVGTSKHINQVENSLSNEALLSSLIDLKQGTHLFISGLHPRYEEEYENLLLPIFVQNSWFGFISFILPSDHPYHSDEELSILKSASEILSNFFEKERNQVEKRNQDKLLETTGRISRTLLMENDYTQALQASLRYLGEAVRYNELYLLKLNQPENNFELASACIVEPIFKTAADFLQIWSELFQTLEVQILNKQSLFLDRSYNIDCINDPELKIRHLVIIPISHAKTVWGILVLVSNKHEYHLRQQHFPILESIADSFGGALMRLQTQEELIETKNQSEQANRSKSEFLANMSHEIRTPMNAILGFAQLMKNTNEEEEREEFADLILDSGNKLLSLITDVMDLSNVEIGKTHINKNEIELAPIVVSILKQYETTIKKKKLDVKLAIQNKLPVFISDTDKLAKIFDSLISNAVKFTEKGSITIDICIKVVNENTGNLFIKVKDTGIGIPADKQTLIFDAFEQADKSKTRRYSGMGLGLTLMSRITRILNGTIELDSTVDKGSTFILTIPVELPKHAEVATHITDDTLALNSIDILAAEDNKINRILLKKIFEKTKYHLHTVENGAQACDFLIANPETKLVLMDIHMPVMSGTEATQAIRTNKLIKHIPIIALTASVLQEDINLCFEAGMNDFLEKPLQNDRLFALLNKWCG